MNISAVLACRNEEPFIQAWLEQTSTYASEILIAVHAPTDATADIIARFKPHSPVPIHCEWFSAQTVARFGYSVMKNEMIARAAGDWVTSIDADEEIGMTQGELGEAMDAATSASCSSLSLQLAEHPSPQDVPGHYTMDHRALLRVAHRPSIHKCKIFRNRAGFWWRGIIHESLSRQGRHAMMFGYNGGAYLHHYAYLRGSKPEWKDALYSFLICRARDCPHERGGTDRFWYMTHYEGDEAGVRGHAAQFASRRHDWFPEMPRRVF